MKPRRRYRPALEPVEPRLLLTAFAYFVDALTDTGAGTGFSGDLRYAITQANLNPGSTITIDTSGTVDLTSALPDIAVDMTITASNPGTFTVEGGGPISNYRALTINSGVTASISGVDFSGFDTTTDGAILDVEGTLTLDDSQLSSSSTTGNGGGVLVNGTLTADGCIFEFLSGGSEALGGAIVNNGTLTVLGGGFGNCSGEDGGAIGSLGSSSLDVNGVIFIDNTASFVGGAIYCYGSTITDSTITGNSASNNGGGIYLNAGTLTLTNDTIANNTASSGAVGAGVLLGFATVLMNNTIVAQNTAGANEADLGTVGGPGLNGSIDSSSSHNLIGNTTVSGISDGSNGNMIGTSVDPIDAMVAAPALNGGPVVNQALETGSPAIGAGLVADAVDPTTSDPLLYDQRGVGFPRVVNNSVDIGSFQTQATATSLSVSSGFGVYGGTTTLTATLTSGGDPIAGELVDFHIGSTDFGTMTTDINGVATLSNVSLSSLNAGTYTGAITAGFDGDSSFGASSGNATLTVTPASLTITADNQTKVYGDALPTLTASYSGFVNGDTSASLATLPTVTTTATAFSDVAGSPYAITASGAVDPDYSISYVSGSLTISQAPLTVVIDNLSKVYGQANPTLTGSVAGVLNGDDVAASYTTAATQFSDVQVGGYAITFAGLTGGKAFDYSTTVVGGSSTPGVLTVTPAPLTVVADDLSKVYGQANPALEGFASGILNGDDVAASYTTAATQFSDVQVGGYAITFAGLTGGKAFDYSTTVVGGSSTPGVLTVTPAPLTVVADNQTKVYGQANPTLTGTVTGALNGDDVGASYTTSAGQFSDVVNGGYAITFAGLTGAKAGDYSTTVVGGSFTPATLSVTPAPLTVVADDLSKVYGQANPNLTGSVTGILNGDDVVVNYTTGAAQFSDVGNYGIIFSGLTGTKASDYSPTVVGGSFTPATLRVTPAPLTIVANNQTKVYGQANPNFTGAVTGVLNGDDVGASYASTAGPFSDVVNGGYTITLAGLTGAKAGDYSTTVTGGSSTPGTLTVTPAPLTVHVADQSKVYGQVNPPTTGVFQGVLNGDDVSVDYGTAATQSSHVQAGGYPISATGLSGAKSGDYSLSAPGASVATGRLTIVPAPLTIAANNLTTIYGAAVPNLTASFFGFVNGDTPASLTTPVSLSTTASPASHVGQYPIAAAGASSGDYSISFLNGSLSVTPALLIVTANNAVKPLNGPLPTLTETYQGFVNGDTSASLTTPVSLSTTATGTSAAGVYLINASGGTSPDYTIVGIPGVVVIQDPVLPTYDPGDVAFVTSLYVNLVGRTPESTALGVWATQLSQGVPPKTVALRIYNSPEARSFRVHHHGHGITLQKALTVAKRAQRAARA